MAPSARATDQRSSHALALLLDGVPAAFPFAASPGRTGLNAAAATITLAAWRRVDRAAVRL